MTVHPRFEKAAALFRASLEDDTELGAGFAVVVDGETVLDLTGGFRDRKKEVPWTDDTITCIYSSGKSVLALLAAMAVDRGLLSYEEKVSQYWPEFTGDGRENLTLGQILSHQSGLCGFGREMDPALWIDWTGLCARLTEEPPLFAPGSASGYHPQTFGFLVGEVLRRVTGKTPGPLIRDWLSDPFGLSVYCGMSDAEQARTAAMTKPPMAPDLGDITPCKKAAFLEKWSNPGGISKEDWAAAEVPGSNIHADAISLARLLNAFATRGVLDGTRLFNEETYTELSQERISGEDLVLPFRLSWAAGLMRNSNSVYGPVAETLGHSGFGGSAVFADPVNRLSFAYVPNKMSPYLMGDPRALALAEAVYDCLQAEE